MSTPLRVTAWILAVAAVVIGGDLLGRLATYRVMPNDEGIRALRRPLKDTGLALLQRTASPASHDLTVYDLYLKRVDEERLQQQLTALQVLGGNAQQVARWLPARIKIDGVEYDARVRLRGEQYYHGVPPRPSLRVRLRRGGAYRGAIVFNLIEPFDKIPDLTFLWEAQAQGGLNWDTSMGILALRGQPVSLVQYVEQVRRPTVDRNARAEGTVFKGTGQVYDEGSDFGRCSPRVERIGQIMGDSDAKLSYAELADLFDLEKLRWFTALTELSGSRHGWLNVNLKGYCDPISLLSEFWIWDTSFGDWSLVSQSRWKDHGVQLLRIDRYRTEHDRALYTLATERVEAMLGRLAKFKERYGTLLARDPFNWAPRGGEAGGWMFRRPQYFPAILRQNASNIVRALENRQLEWRHDATNSRLLLRNPDRGSKVVTGYRNARGTIELPTPQTIPGRFEDHRPVVAIEITDTSPVLGLIANNLHTGEAADLRESQDISAPEIAPITKVPTLTLPEGFRHGNNGWIEAGPGEVRLSRHLFLPPGEKLRIKPGTTLSLGASVLMEVRGSLDMRGTPERPIRIVGHDPTTFGAVAVIATPDHWAQVRLSNLEITGGAGSNQGRARYTASLAIYYANVEIDRMRILSSQADDAINLKHTVFDVRDAEYLDGAGDAVDYDFSDGTDLRTRIARFPDDGIDLSGATASVVNATIYDVGDKALSLGEASTPEIRNVTVIGANMGCAIKDRTVARVHGLTVVRANTAVSAYTKKLSFGSARGVFTDLVAADVGGLAIVDSDSELKFVNSQRIVDRTRPNHFKGVTHRVLAEIKNMSDDELLERATAIRRASWIGARATDLDSSP